MKIPRSKRQCNRITALLCLIALELCVFLPGSFAEQGNGSLSPAEIRRLGERMFREGLLPSGKPMQAVAGEHTLPGSNFACAGCHQRGGFGTDDEGVYYPPVTGSQLYAPVNRIPERTGKERHPREFPAALRRPAYTDETLAVALRTGVDPVGRRLNVVMPRYQLDQEEMAILISYLKSLSSQFSPGVKDSTVHLATVMTDDVSQRERDEMLVSLLNFVDARNSQARLLTRLKDIGKGKFVVMGGDMMNALGQHLELSTWLLKGPPETWRSQLEEHYRNDPVFALIGGITKGEWKPIHQFSEDNRIPCLFPDTDFPVVSRSDWYTWYMSKGLYQEGEAAAHYLSNHEELLKEGPVVQIVRDSREGRALATGFSESWRELGREEPVTLTLKPGEALTRETVRRLPAKERPLVLLWDGAAAPSELEALAEGEKKPVLVFVSSGYLGKGIWSLKKELRDLTYLTYPYKLPGSAWNRWNRTDGTNPSPPPPEFSAAADKRSNQYYTLTQVLTMALMDMKGNYYRDNFMDVIGMIGDLDAPLYERLNFSPQQRYASQGCYIVQLSKDPKPVLVKKSGWEIY